MLIRAEENYGEIILVRTFQKPADTDKRSRLVANFSVRLLIHLNDTEFTKYAQLMINTSSNQILDIDDLGYQEKEILFMFTELYYRLKPINSIILYDQPGWLDNEVNTRITTLLREVGDNNQIWTTLYPTRTSHLDYSEVIRIEDHLKN